MIDFILFTDYYRGEKLCTTAKDRYDITHKKGAHETFETQLLNKRKFNVKGLSFNYGKFEYGKSKLERKPNMSISRNGHISGVFVPDLENTKIAFGDIIHTEDGIILLINEDYSVIEIFIARGKLRDIKHIYNEVKNGEYNHEIETMRAEAIEVFKKPKVTESVTIDLFQKLGLFLAMYINTYFVTK
jgi:hypothetical protein